MPRLILLNGPPGIGKSTIAARYVADHPWTLDCDVDVLRGLIGGWEQDFGRAGTLIRPAALAFITGYLRTGHDVVLPQLLVDPEELARFEAAADEAGATLVEVVLWADRDESIARFHRRGDDATSRWHERVREIVASSGGDELLGRFHDRLAALVRDRGQAVVTSVDGDIDATYSAVLVAVSTRP